AAAASLLGRSMIVTASYSPNAKYRHSSLPPTLLTVSSTAFRRSLPPLARRPSSPRIVYLASIRYFGISTSWWLRVGQPSHARGRQGKCTFAPRVQPAVSRKQDQQQRSQAQEDRRNQPVPVRLQSAGVPDEDREWQGCGDQEYGHRPFAARSEAHPDVGGEPECEHQPGGDAPIVARIHRGGHGPAVPR